MSRLNRFQMIFVALSAVCIHSSLIAADTCPLWPIIDNGDGTFVYYCDYYPSGCGTGLEARELEGNYNWPIDCLAGDACPTITRAPGGGFGGYKGGKWTHSQNFEFPNGPARHCARLEPGMKPVRFIEVRYKPTTGPTKTFFAKLFRHRVKVNNARGGNEPGGSAGGPPRTVFVAFEIDALPGGMTTPDETYTNIGTSPDVIKKSPNSEFAYFINSKDNKPILVLLSE